MARDSFTHDEGSFEPEARPGGVVIADAEAKYADLLADVIWQGAITPEARERLEIAATLFGLPAERVAQIEEALLAGHQAHLQMQFVEDDDHEAPVSIPISEELTPIAPSEDPTTRVLQQRIGKLEEQNDALTRDNYHLQEQVDALENVVSQLQFALESTMNDLDKASRDLGDARGPGLSQVGVPSQPLASHVGLHLPGAPSHPALPQDAPSFAGWTQADISYAPPSNAGLSHLELNAPSQAGLSYPGAGGFDADDAPPAAASHTQIRAALVDEANAEAARLRHNPADIHRKLRRRPRDPDLLRALFRSLGRGADTDRRWCIAHALSFLGHATADEQALFEAHQDAHLVRPRRAVNDDEWRELLFHPGEDELTGEILAAIAPAVLLGQMTAIRASIPPAVLEDDTRVDPRGSTLQAVRCMSWAAAFLGLEVPTIHVCPNHDDAADVVLNPVPTTRLGRRALTGRSSRELAFLAGRHLSWYRREHLLGRPQRSVRRLEDMFLAALMIGNPGLPLSSDIRQRVEPIAKTIRPLLDAPAVEKLQACFVRFVEFGGRTNLGQWMRGAERTADCAGMLLCNDLWAAHSMLRTTDPAHVEMALDDLICFITADRYTMLRRRIGIAVGEE